MGEGGRGGGQPGIEDARDLRIAEIVELDMQLEGGAVIAYRAKVKLSFKYEGGD